MSGFAIVSSFHAREDSPTKQSVRNQPFPHTVPGSQEWLRPSGIRIIYRQPGPTVAGKVSLPVFAAGTTSRSTHLPSFLQFGANCEQISNYAQLKLKLKNVILSRGNSRCRISRS